MFGLKKRQQKLVTQLIEYMISGGAYFWTGYGVFALCWSVLGWNLWWAKLAANLIGWSVNFILQRYWVFRNPHLKGHMGEVTGRFIFITLVDFLLDYLIVYGLVQIGITPYIGQFASSGFFTVWNYLWYRFWVFPEKLAVQTYYPLVYAEFFSGTRRFDGRKYGKKIEDSCGPEVLRRILGGSEITKEEFFGRYYKKALEVKEIIREEFERAFKEVDCIFAPVVPGVPWKVGEGLKMKPEEVYAYDACTIPANLAGICAMSTPTGVIKEGKEDIPIGLQIKCEKREESKMLSIAKMIEKL